MSMMMLYPEQFISSGPVFFPGSQSPAAYICGMQITDREIGRYPEQPLQIIDQGPIASGHFLGGEIPNMLAQHRLPVPVKTEGILKIGTGPQYFNGGRVFRQGKGYRPGYIAL